MNTTTSTVCNFIAMPDSNRSLFLDILLAVASRDTQKLHELKQRLPTAQPEMDNLIERYGGAAIH